MRNIIKYGLMVIIIAVLGYFSVDIKQLSAVHDSKTQAFDAAGYVKKLWAHQLPARLDSAVDFSVLRASLQAQADKGFEQYTNALAIGNYRYALVKGTARVDQVKEDEVLMTIEADPAVKAVMAMEFVYGNAVRDALGLIDLKDFPNTNDLNAVSEALNQTVREKVVPAITPLLQPGATIEFTGAVELNKEHLHFDNLEIIPLRIKPVS